MICRLQVRSTIVSSRWRARTKVHKHPYCLQPSKPNASSHRLLPKPKPFRFTPNRRRAAIRWSGSLGSQVLVVSNTSPRPALLYAPAIILAVQEASFTEVVHAQRSEPTAQSTPLPAHRLSRPRCVGKGAQPVWLRHLDTPSGCRGKDVPPGGQQRG